MVTAATANGIRARVMADPLRLRLVDAAVLRILRLRLSPSAPEVDPGNPSNQVGEIPQALVGRLWNRRGGPLWPPAADSSQRRPSLAAFVMPVGQPRLGTTSVHVRARAVSSGPSVGQSCSVAGSKSAPFGQTSV